MIKLYNTLTRKKEEFKPLKEGRVGLYTYGPTRKIYKVPKVVSVSSLRIVNMLPGDLVVAGCFIFCGGFNFERYFGFC